MSGADNDITAEMLRDLPEKIADAMFKRLCESGASESRFADMVAERVVAKLADREAVQRLNLPGASR